MLTIPVLAVLLCLVTVVEHAPDWAAGAAVTLAAVLIGATLLTPPSTGDRPVFLLSALGVAAVARGRNRRARRMVLASLRDRAEQAERTQRTMAQAAVADERRRIAREVHDIVSHNIAVMTTLADGATVALRNDRGLADACEAVQAIAGTGREAMQEMRALLGVLRDPDDPTDFGDSGRPPAPGLADLQALVDQVRTAGLPTVLQVHGKPVPLGGGTGLTVYRLVQEALSNSLRHACNATSASVSLHWADSHLSITVTDDGHPPTFPAPSGGLGLVGMRERVLAHGGTVTSGPMAAGGWGVRARLPLTAPHPEVAT
ncbi:sensor histidine kinase [Modestobacter sp. Leaf380]|uniref:sensor histidine kinase n=1 Tax=Modestobacter sp. Leaf380 TaxID=1736356 RepID=UPI0006F81532|nr:sensor histidine kinase [Modestobacter sp. Leaf380]KQS65712.1 hypothetical protein ASG41_14000 [Modestobacter sp. Leaf380]